ncbi:MAG: TIGR02302 family protein [Phyllobacterium sp.]
MADDRAEVPDEHNVGGHLIADIVRARRSAFATMSFERFWPKILPLILVAALFAIFSWSGLFRLMPEWLRLANVAGFGLAGIASLYPLTRFRLPTREELDRRIEITNALAHEPVSVQSEELAAGTTDPFSRALWDEHRRRMAERLKNLHGSLPRTHIPERDPWGLRAAVALLFVTAFAFSMGPLGGRLSDAFRVHAGAEAVPPRIDAWVTPPRYTGRAPVFLTSDANSTEQNFTVPDGSTVVVRVIGGSGEEVLNQTGSDGEATEIAALPANASASGGQTSPTANTRNFHLTLDDNTALALHDGSSALAAWSFTVIPDKPPAIRYAKEPARALNGTLELAYTIDDDYGAASGNAQITLVDDKAAEGARPLYKAPELPLTLPRRNNEKKEAVTTKDLSEHPWAGAQVRMTLTATDDSGQQGFSEPKTFILPERPFSNPLARAIIEQRGILALDAHSKPRILDMLDAITIRPDETIRNASHYLALTSLISRLRQARSDDQLRETVAYMWEIARGIEDGGLSDAEKRLRQAQEALKQALAQGASDQEIEQRMKELREAMQEFLREFAQRAQQNPNMAQQMPDPNAQELTQDDINRMLDQIEELAKQGATDQAQQLLSQLENLMNNLQMGQNQQGQRGQQMNKLGDLMRRQQQMMNETNRLQQQLDRGNRGEGQQGQQGEQGQRDQRQQGGEMSEEDIGEALRGLQQGQNQLQSDLQQLMDDLKNLGIDPGQEFGEADSSMGQAGDALGQAEGNEAIDQQSSALDALRRGAQGMMKQMQQAMGENGPTGNRGSRNSDDRDPLGRPRATTGPDFGESVKVPDEIDIQRAREILDAIRRRLGNALSPQLEKEYLERLLKFN